MSVMVKVREVLRLRPEPWLAGMVLMFVPLAGPVMMPAQEASTTATPVGDAARGKALFERRCTGCHSLDQSKEGPRLRGVVGRKAGSVEGFEYSAAVKGAGFVWDEAKLERWLTDTDAFLPGNNMDFRVVNAQERADVIRYLKSLSE